MTRNVQFDFSFESDSDEFDPFEEVEEEAEEEDGSYEAGSPAVTTAAEALEASGEKPVVPVDNRTAEERTADLLTSMNSQRKTLLNILSFCIEKQTVTDVNNLVEKLKEYNYSVYSAADLCTLLEKAGALERVTAEGEDATEVKAEPKTVVVDGVEYLEAAEAPETFWLTTSAGQAALDADKPLERMHELLESDATYASIYERVLSLCSAEGGANTKDLGNEIDDDPMLQKPRYYATRFVDRLEKCDALEWKGAWCITDIGKQALDFIATIKSADESAGEASATQKEA